MVQQSSGSWWTVVSAVVMLIAGHLALKYGIKPPIPSNLLYAYTVIIAIAISIGVGMIPVASDKFFMKLPHAFAPFFHSGILLASISAVLLNAHFNGLRSEEEASALAQEAGKQADAAH